MRLNKLGIVVDCKQCTYTSSDDPGAFDVIVPIIDSETGISGPAKLHCTISKEQHAVELLEWQDVNLDPAPSSGNLQQRVTDALSIVAEHQVCGNRKICPSEVVEIVEESSNSNIKG
jgi:hypothetical protein